MANVTNSNDEPDADPASPGGSRTELTDASAVIRRAEDRQQRRRRQSASVSTSSGHSKCATRRRSILSIALRLALLLQIGRTLAGPARAIGAAIVPPPPPACSTSAAIAICRVLDRREGDEPGVVARFPGSAAAQRFSPERHDLRGAGLAGDLDAGERAPSCRCRGRSSRRRASPRGPARGARLAISACADHLGLDLLADAAVGGVDALHVVRAVARATVGDRRGEVRHLQRRRRHVALTDRDRQRLARDTRAA